MCLIRKMFSKLCDRKSKVYFQEATLTNVVKIEASRSKISECVKIQPYSQKLTAEYQGHIENIENALRLR